MIRLSRLADYGVSLMVQIAVAPGKVHSAQSLAGSSGIPMPTVSKLLSALARARLLTASRGAKGGYELATPAADISVAEIISAVDGPIALTQCIELGPGSCEVEFLCPTRRGWQAINDGVRKALEAVSLAEFINRDDEYIQGPEEYSMSQIVRTD